MQNIEYFLEYVTTIIVEKCGISKKEILPLSKISGDLGIEGDDAKALLKSIETNLKIDLQLDINRFFLRESHLLLGFFEKKPRDLSVLELSYLVKSAYSSSI
jgi:hypothetical protein